MSYETLLYGEEEGVVRITLNRPNVHNCLNHQLITELLTALQTAEKNKALRLLILQAVGPSFCAGADLTEMKQMRGAGFEENIQEASRLSQLLTMLRTFSSPTLVLVQGAVYGGGCGLVACCDLAMAASTATFCFPEVRLGLVPALISPYIYEKIGESYMRYYFMTAESIDALQAQRLGLVHQVVLAETLQAETSKLIRTLLNNGPAALKTVKELIHTVVLNPKNEATKQYAIKCIVNLRLSAEGQEGAAAFFEKRAPAWRNS